MTDDDIIDIQDRILALLERYHRAGSTDVKQHDDKWFRMDLVTCDLCPEPAVWRHLDGGYRCSTCPRPAKR